jgi:dethiobiotin synthetase
MTDRGLLVTGTDTGVGKTLVCTAIARLLRRQGKCVRVCKPVATGAAAQAGHWRADDTVRLAEAAAETDLDAVTPWAFPAPAAPPVAARDQGMSLRLDDLVRAVNRRRQPGAFLLVEGVGGLLCPLTERETVADLARRLALPLVVVARRSLGTLNHTLLTLAAARHAGLAVAGVVVNETAPPAGLADETNVAELQKRIDVPVLAVVPHATDEARAAQVADAALAAIDWWQVGRSTCVSPGGP